MTATGGAMEEMILPCDLWNVHFTGYFAFWVLCIHTDSSFELPQQSLGNYTSIKRYKLYLCLVFLYFKCYFQLFIYFNFRCLALLIYNGNSILLTFLCFIHSFFIFFILKCLHFLHLKCLLVTVFQELGKRLRSFPKFSCVY